ncbi:MAG: hypothetical protein QW680_05770 [Pyrobaculum sp.]
MRRVLLTLALAAIVVAIDTGALETILGEMQTTALTVLQIIYKSIPVIALGLLALWAFLRRDVDTLMRSTWFYVVITAFVVWLILGVAARVSPEFAPLYQAVTGNGCPFYWCP